MTKEEYNSFLLSYQKYNNIIDKVISEYDNQEIVLDMNPLSKETFSSLVASNNWSVKQITFLKFLLSED